MQPPHKGSGFSQLLSALVAIGMKHKLIFLKDHLIQILLDCHIWEV